MEHITRIECMPECQLRDCLAQDQLPQVRRLAILLRRREEGYTRPQCASNPAHCMPAKRDTPSRTSRKAWRNRVEKHVWNIATPNSCNRVFAQVNVGRLRDLLYASGRMRQATYRSAFDAFGAGGRWRRRAYKESRQCLSTLPTKQFLFPPFREDVRQARRRQTRCLKVSDLRPCFSRFEQGFMLGEVGQGMSGAGAMEGFSYMHREEAAEFIDEVLVCRVPCAVCVCVCVTFSRHVKPSSCGTLQQRSTPQLDTCCAFRGGQHFPERALQPPTQPRSFSPNTMEYNPYIEYGTKR